jgi:hypothetical protein
VKRMVLVCIGPLALAALSGSDGVAGDRLSAAAERAVSCYVNDKGEGGTAWPCPDFFPGGKASTPEKLRLSVEDSIWRSLEAEAESQGISAERLFEHAVLYYAAELDAGRATQRILEED